MSWSFSIVGSLSGTSVDQWCSCAIESKRTRGHTPLLIPEIGWRMSVTLMRHGDVDDSQHHEYVRLQQDDQDMEDRPGEAEQDGEEGADEAGPGRHPQQQEDDLARVHVAEQH